MHSTDCERSRALGSSPRTDRVRISTEPSYLTRLAIVYAHPIRLTIVTQLHMREMSPTEFYDSFGGTSASAVHWHFNKLVEHGWLRHVRKKRGPRGRPQNYYRTTELAVINDDTWAELPLSIRTPFSLRTLEQLGERVGVSLDAGTFDSRDDRHLTWTSIILDEAGWSTAIDDVNGCFRSLSQEQADAKVRLDQEDAQPFEMTVALAAFESPQASDLHRQAERRGPFSLGPGLVPTNSPAMRLDSPLPLPVRLAKVFVDPLNLKIVADLNLGVQSPSQLAAKFDTSTASIDRRCKILADLGWIVRVSSDQSGTLGRGVFYCATGPAVFDTEVWASVPLEARKGASWTTFKQFSEKASEALVAETFDARVERHLSWSPLLVDERAWEQVISILDEFFKSLYKRQEAAKSRLARSNENGLIATFFFAGFESPHGGLSASPAF
jgi:DNA-binding HxlR family transcriptional regulator